jgi:hypothetical protein
MTRIFLETKHEKTNEGRFIKYLLSLIGKSNEVELIGTDGYTNIEKYATQLERYSTIGDKNLVIFDADYKFTNGGFVQRNGYLQSLKTKYNIQFDLFLYPDNQNDGLFEDLLEQITTSQHNCLLQCFGGYQNCISSNNNAGQYQLPIQKTKMYAYIDTMTKTQAQKAAFTKGDWFFDNPDYWDFYHSALDPLKNFLNTSI